MNCETSSHKHKAATWIYLAGCLNYHIKTYHLCAACHHLLKNFNSRIGMACQCDPECTAPVMEWLDHEL